MFQWMTAIFFLVGAEGTGAAGLIYSIDVINKDDYTLEGTIMFSSVIIWLLMILWASYIVRISHRRRPLALTPPLDLPPARLPSSRPPLLRPPARPSTITSMDGGHIALDLAFFRRGRATAD